MGKSYVVWLRIRYSRLFCFWLREQKQWAMVADLDMVGCSAFGCVGRKPCAMGYDLANTARAGLSVGLLWGIWLLDCSES